MVLQSGMYPEGEMKSSIGPMDVSINGVTNSSTVAIEKDSRILKRGERK